MKREIKFRGKVKHHNPMTNPENGWVVGYYFQNLTQGEMCSYIFQLPCSWEVIPETVGQFTGLLDKNGKEVYEGDIVIFDNHLQGVSQVVYDYAGFDVVSNNYRTTLRPKMNNHIRVIGNIHDNTELLKGGEE